ncbi:MAG: Uma2 family endonuclease [Bacteroidota bacterium]
MTPAEYNQLEEENHQRYEYHGGQVFAIAGGDPKHGEIANNIGRLLGNALFDKDCTVFNSDVKYHIASVSKSYYPDVSVVCGSAQRSEKEIHALTNPLPLVEVLSDSTAAQDRGSKFHTYSQMPSLREYVLVEQDT